jgi:hypothetical protein
MSTELVTFDDMQRMGAALAKSGLFGIKSADQAIALMMVAQAEGQHPATIAQDYDIIQGRASRKTHSVLARFQAAGGCVSWTTLTDTEAEATFSHPQGGALSMRWTFDQASKAGLTGKDNWKNYPRAMLRARCIAEGVRAVYPAAIGGMLVSEEAQDMPAVPSKPMGRAEVVRDEPSEALITDARAAASLGLSGYQRYWKAITKENRAALAGYHEEMKAAATSVDAGRTVENEAADKPSPAVDKSTGELDPFIVEMNEAERTA